MTRLSLIYGLLDWSFPDSKPGICKASANGVGWIHKFWEKCRTEETNGYSVCQLPFALVDGVPRSVARWLAIMLRDHILPYRGTKHLGAISSRDISVQMTTLEAKGLGQQTRKHVLSLVNKRLGDAVHHFEFTEINPVKRKHRPKVLLHERPLLRPEESLKLLNFSKPHYLAPAIWLGRPAELIREKLFQAVDAQLVNGLQEIPKL